MSESEVKYSADDRDQDLTRWKFTNRIGDGSGDHEADCMDFVQLAPRLKPGGTILDIGCGVGRFLIMGVDRHASAYYGLEPDQERYRQCVGEGLHAKHIKLLNMTSGQFRRAHPDLTFDVVYLSMVLQHVSTDVAAAILADVFALLKPGGLALISTTHHIDQRFGAEAHPASFDQIAFNAYAADPPSQQWGVPVRYWSKQSFTQALEDAGLEVLTWRQFSYYLPESLPSFEPVFGISGDEFKHIGSSQFALVTRA